MDTMSPALSRSTTSRGGGEPSTRLLGVPEVAERLSVSKQSVYRLIYAGDLFSVKSGSRRLIPDVAVDAYIAQLVADAS